MGHGFGSLIKSISRNNLRQYPAIFQTTGRLLPIFQNGGICDPKLTAGIFSG
jgi:hypothetical protein